MVSFATKFQKHTASHSAAHLAVMAHFVLIHRVLQYQMAGVVFLGIALCYMKQSVRTSLVLIWATIRGALEIHVRFLNRTWVHVASLEYARLN
jgi:hypothetical protein